MSFQDVGKRNSQRQPVNAAMSSNSPKFNANRSQLPPAAPRSGPTAFGSMAGMSASSATTQISDSLTQYQRNVGILEKIAHALLSNTGGSSKRDELEQQYKAQSDVLRELESRLKAQIKAQRERLSNQSQTSAQKQALLKLERDFERVQSISVATKAKVTKQMKQYQQRDAALRDEATAKAEKNNSLNILQQQQLQIQQDRLQEEIMRERDEEIRKINRGMHQVNEIYKDLAHIVGEQQEDIDNIETKMEESKAAATSGLEQVAKANDKYGSSAAQNCVIS